MNVDPGTIFQVILGAGLIGLGKWVWNLNAKVATFVTREQLGEFQKELSSNFNAIHTELKKVAEDLAYLRGRSEH
jgi:hypothetical protein